MDWPIFYNGVGTYAQAHELLLDLLEGISEDLIVSSYRHRIQRELALAEWGLGRGDDAWLRARSIQDDKTVPPHIVNQIQRFTDQWGAKSR